jgi:hypothetical protein
VTIVPTITDRAPAASVRFHVNDAWLVEGVVPV